MWKYVRIPNVCIIGSMQKKAYDFITTLKFLDFFSPPDNIALKIWP